MRALFPPRPFNPPRSRTLTPTLSAGGRGSSHLLLIAPFPHPGRAPLSIRATGNIPSKYPLSRKREGAIRCFGVHISLPAGTSPLPLAGEGQGEGALPAAPINPPPHAPSPQPSPAGGRGSQTQRRLPPRMPPPFLVHEHHPTPPDSASHPRPNPPAPAAPKNVPPTLPKPHCDRLHHTANGQPNGPPSQRFTVRIRTLISAPQRGAATGPRCA